LEFNCLAENRLSQDSQLNHAVNLMLNSAQEFGKQWIVAIMVLGDLVLGHGFANNGFGYSVALYKPTKSCRGQLSVRIGYTLSCKFVSILLTGYALNVFVVSIC
jgi:hypothetical protein